MMQFVHPFSVYDQPVYSPKVHYVYEPSYPSYQELAIERERQRRAEEYERYELAKREAASRAIAQRRRQRREQELLRAAYEQEYRERVRAQARAEAIAARREQEALRQREAALREAAARERYLSRRLGAVFAPFSFFQYQDQYKSESDAEQQQEDVEMGGQDQDPEISVPHDEDEDEDIYSQEVPPTNARIPVPLQHEKEEQSAPPLSDVVKEFVDQFEPSREATPEPTEKVFADPVATPEPVAEPEVDESETLASLATIEKNVQRAVETYERISRSGSQSSGSEDEDASSNTVRSLNSRIKVLQKAQTQLEQQYTKLDTLPSVSSEEAKTAKHELTTRSVSTADKVDDLLRDLESQKQAAVEREQAEAQAEAAAAAAEEERVAEESLAAAAAAAAAEDSEEIASTANVTPEPEVQVKQEPSATPNDRKRRVRKVVIETVDDDSDF